MENTGQRARKDIAPSQSGKDKPEKSIERKKGEQRKNIADLGSKVRYFSKKSEHSMLAGEPYILEYPANITEQLQQVKGLILRKMVELVAGQVSLWILKKKNQTEVDSF